MEKQNPKVFVSYSWSSPEHEQWVEEKLVERLFSDGIEVKFDKYDLKEGQDKYEFMEQMVKDESIKKVLMICDKKYMDKANSREGGVGTESQIISPEVYENTKQEKFIPIVSEVDKEGKPYLPTYLKSRIYIDLSDEADFENEYEKLVRNICGKPEHKKPILGNLPSYIIDDEPIKSKTSNYPKQIENALLNGKKIVNGLIQDFFDAFFESLEDNRIDTTKANMKEFDDLVVKSIERMECLRDDFVKVTTVILKYIDNFDLDKFHEFFEKFASYSYPPEGMNGSYYQIQFDNFRFLSKEIFLYFIVILINFGKYKEAGYFINSTYFYKSYNNLINTNAKAFDAHIASLEEMRNERLFSNNRYSVVSDLLSQRAKLKQISFDSICEVEYILFIVTLNKYNNQGLFGAYYPRCLVGKYYYKSELFEKIKSKRYFQKVKDLFLAEDIENFKQIINSSIKKANDYGYYRSVFLPRIESVIDLDNVATID